MVGNISNYTQIDVIRALLKVEKPVSRSKLTRELGLGEGTLRTILGILKKRGLIQSSKRGHRLSPKGEKQAGLIRRYIKDIKPIASLSSTLDLYPQYKKVGIQLRSIEVVNAVGLRDHAIKNGAEAALIMVYKDKLRLIKDKLRLMDESYNKDFNNLEQMFRLSKGDVLIITCGFDIRWLENAALAVAVEACPSLKKAML